MNLQPLRFVYAAALIALMFVHFGVYHSALEPCVMGILWGYYLPIGYVGLLFGLLVIVYPKTGPTKKFSFPFLMIAIGFFLILSTWLTPREFFVTNTQNQLRRGCD